MIFLKIWYCSWTSKGQKSGTKTNSPAYIYIYISLSLSPPLSSLICSFLSHCVSFSCVSCLCSLSLSTLSFCLHVLIEFSFVYVCLLNCEVGCMVSMKRGVSISRGVVSVRYSVLNVQLLRLNLRHFLSEMWTVCCIVPSSLPPQWCQAIWNKYYRVYFEHFLLHFFAVVGSASVDLWSLVFCPVSEVCKCRPFIVICVCVGVVRAAFVEIPGYLIYACFCLSVYLWSCVCLCLCMCFLAYVLRFRGFTVVGSVERFCLYLSVSLLLAFCVFFQGYFRVWGFLFVCVHMRVCLCLVVCNLLVMLIVGGDPFEWASVILAPFCLFVLWVYVCVSMWLGVILVRVWRFPACFLFGMCVCVCVLLSSTAVLVR